MKKQFTVHYSCKVIHYEITIKFVRGEFNSNFMRNRFIRSTNDGKWSIQLAYIFKLFFNLKVK